jgi:hypothetical protein
MPDEVLTIKEVAALLKLAEKTDRWIDAQPRGGESGGGVSVQGRVARP